MGNYLNEAIKNCESVTNSRPLSKIQTYDDKQLNSTIQYGEHNSSLMINSTLMEQQKDMETLKTIQENKEQLESRIMAREHILKQFAPYSQNSMDMKQGVADYYSAITSSSKPINPKKMNTYIPSSVCSHYDQANTSGLATPAIIG
jgi:hypothetical protein